MESTTLNSLELTDYEATELHDYERRAAEYSREVGCFVTRSGKSEDIELGARLFLELVSLMESDTRVRTGALRYGLFWAGQTINSRNASQAYQLRATFLRDVYLAAIAEREAAK